VSQLLSESISTWPTLPYAHVQKVLNHQRKTYHTLAALLKNPASMLLRPDNLGQLTDLLNGLPEFKTRMVRLIPWVRNLLAGKNVSENDLESLRTVVHQILARP
jgi:hypothetical protein